MTRREALLALAIGDETTARTLARLFPSASFLLMDPASGLLIASHWDAPPNAATPLGSLMKPLVALAHGSPFPEIECRACWKPDGHGRLGLTEALAQSCNAYFLALAKAVAPEAMARTAIRYGLPVPDVQTPEAWIGLGSGWRVPPAALLRAYGRFDGSVLPGLRRSAERGTARACGGDAYAKTGTGPCIHHPKGRGDGYAVALFPAETPRFALLVSAHNRPGSEAARTAGEMRRAMPASGRYKAPAA